MKNIEIFDPAMCCSTGVCGPSCPQPPSMSVVWPVAVTGQLSIGHPQCHWHLEKTNECRRSKTD
ncbi:arsenic metallochaperone ArsD family protein, partial [Heyndrickxia coagulans]|uniref:arsenic metallochaperone ArsD family protein n=1 Tax=Heyndrickxia coagulans TaxID=1398 RepID=UPI00214D79AC